MDSVRFGIHNNNTKTCGRNIVDFVLDFVFTRLWFFLSYLFEEEKLKTSKYRGGERETAVISFHRLTFLMLVTCRREKEEEGTKKTI